MKLRIPILAIISSMILGCAGLQPAPESELTFERVVDAPGFTKDQLFEASKVWIAQNFRSAKAVLEYENKAEGKIIGNGIINYPCDGIECLGKSDWSAHFTMQVDIKDQKFKLAFSNLRISWPPKYPNAGFEGSVRSQGDLDSIKPALLKFGDQMAASMRKTKSGANW